MKVFISYSHADDELIERLRKHLAQLERDGTISEWIDGEIHAGARLHEEIQRELQTAGIFLACASPDYIASYSCYETELAQALERERAGTLAIVPVILEPCDWLATPLQDFKAVPRDGKPVSEFTNTNIALLEVANELRRLTVSRITPITEEPGAAMGATDSSSSAASARYRVKREFDELHKRDFAEQSVAEIYRFFEASVSELTGIPEIEARLSAFSSDHFSCTIINRGIKRGFATIHVRRGHNWAPIDFFFGENNEKSTSNGGFSVEADEYQLFLRPTMFGISTRDNEPLNARAAAQIVWDELLKKVGIAYA